MCTCSNVKYLTNNQSDTCHFKYKNCNNKFLAPMNILCTICFLTLHIANAVMSQMNVHICIYLGTFSVFLMTFKFIMSGMCNIYLCTIFYTANQVTISILVFGDFHYKYRTFQQRTV